MTELGQSQLRLCLLYIKKLICFRESLLLPKARTLAAESLLRMTARVSFSPELRPISGSGIVPIKIKNPRGGLITILEVDPSKTNVADIKQMLYKRSKSLGRCVSQTAVFCSTNAFCAMQTLNSHLKGSDTHINPKTSIVKSY